MAYKRTITIALTGGLGNQLFQLAAALSCAGNGTVHILKQQGNPRKNKLGEPEIFSFSLPSNVTVINGGYFKWLSSKIIGFNLRTGFSPTKLESRLLRLIQAVSSITLFILTGRIWKIAVADNLGFPSSLKLKRHTLLIGYFQTDKFIQQLGIHKFIGGTEETSDKITEYQKLSEIEMPLVVHVRLGDYRGEAGIGIVSDNYYLANYHSLWNTGEFQKIWLFSDEPDEAIKLFDSSLIPYVRVIDSQNLSSAQTLELMTFGKGYLIANSTFSWWGAYLSKTANAKVIAPMPWFKNLPEPRFLVPKNWNRAEGFDRLE
jgi:hypothetical protein